MKNIYLIGFMGTGKTTVGKILADEFKMKFVDTDKLVEEMTGRTISEIFEESSEEDFRKFETDVLREITEEKGMIVSTGGGIVVTRGNLELMKNSGFVFTLIADAATIHERLKKDDTCRPLLEVEEPLDEIKRLLFERAAFYINAHHIIETSDITPREAADQIIAILREELSK
ncbi:shikimate kinase [Seleniivibrio sp.]|uniref:shikimate kinase n=1 Tax=Seleniivibrio sp. TaxID=2898801 RepID=UPI0025D77DEE|nr:shikimate kinase [Seleniivibrio sp.]MCD8554072.1 shikimate kinase [Seleniivibrio sp.]